MRAGLGVLKVKQVYERAAGRYDTQHALLTFKTDESGRRRVVRQAVQPGDSILDCGAGTGSTALLAAEAAGPQGHVTLFDLAGAMLDVARQKAEARGLAGRLSFQTGDMLALPFADASFDCVLSTYSVCPLYDPVQGALEMYRVLKPGGRLGVAHSTEPRNAAVRWLARRVEGLAWHFPWLSLGCRPVTVLPALLACGARLMHESRLGFPLWPFLVFVVEKPG